MKTDTTKAKKYNSNKPPLSWLPMVALENEAHVMAFGAKKYDKDNWKKGLPHSFLLDAALRHIYKFSNGERLDSESGLSHLAHARCNLGFLEYYLENGLGEEDL